MGASNLGRMVACRVAYSNGIWILYLLFAFGISPAIAFKKKGRGFVGDLFDDDHVEPFLCSNVFQLQF